ncbi:MAG: DUF547 domain-containing protein [Candidatus Cyclobacteriaceae bacterium M3_2C_046]
MTQWFICLIILWFPDQGNTLADFWSQSHQFFQENVADGLVDYQNIHNHPQPLNQLVEIIEDIELDKLTVQSKKAFLLNVYNLLTIKNIIDHYPVESPMAIKGFFDQPKFKVNGNLISLNELEKEKLMPLDQDPRLHFALVCAARGCPKLASFAYQPDKLDQQLDQITKNSLNDPDFIRTGKSLGLSEIFKWYRQDFGHTDQKLIEYINQYRDQKIDLSKPVDYYSYDWDLNIQEPH